MKILLATDGSDTARAAVDFLVGFPLPTATQVTVATVVKEVLPGDAVSQLSDEHRQAFEAARAAAEDEARDMLDGEIARLGQAGVAAQGRVLVGRPAEQIVRLAGDSKSDIVVVGSHGLSGPRRFLLGSVSDRVFEYAPCSVLIVKPALGDDGKPAGTAPADGPWRLLLAFDDSPPARKAVELCATLPLAGRAAVQAVTVMPMIHMYRQDIRQQLSWVWQEKKQAAQMALDWARTQIDGKRVEVTTELLEESDVAQAILDQAEDAASDLIVIGHKGRTALERFLLGSVTARVAHHAPCSVLCVRK
jgi:nucleotide-binding universal stress UspA family protein